MIYFALVICSILAGCSSQTAAISHAATVTRVSAENARTMLAGAMLELDAIQVQAQAVSDAIPYIDDTVPSYLVVLQYVSVAVVVFVVGSLIYTYLPRKK